MKSILLFLITSSLIAFAFSQTKALDKVVDNGIFPAHKFNVYSGYLNISNTKAFHYIFFESNSLTNATDPLLLWLNGGPGCSSLLGAFYENGPFLFNTDSPGLQAGLNPYSWNNLANVLYIESPAGVGFSTGTDEEIRTNSSDDVTAHDNLNVLLEFYKRFTEYQGRELYIMGESYAGTYVPFFAIMIDYYNNNASTITKINFQGWAVGNGCTHPDECVSLKLKFKGWNSSYAYDFYWGQGKYSPEVRVQYEKECLVNPGSQKCQDIMSVISKQIDTDNLNVYDVYEFCYTEGIPSVPPCSDGRAAYNFFNDDAMKKMLHVNANVTWTMCSDPVGANYTQDPQSSYWIYKQLLPTYKYRVLVFSGDVDASVPITGTKNWINLLRQDLGMPTVSPWRPWFFPGKRADEPQVAGFVVQYPNMTFASVRGIGHMVPQWGPSQAFSMIKAFLNNQDLPYN